MMMVEEMGCMERV